MGVCHDASGNVYITGAYQAPILTFGTYTLNHAGNVDIFLAKYDKNGNVLWAKREGGTGRDQAYSTTVDKEGNVYVTGLFGSSQISFGAFTLNNNGDTDYFVVKYDPNGNVLWAKSGGGNNSDLSFTVKTDSQDNVYITGYTTSTPLIIGTATVNSNPAAAYLVKYDANGNLLWAKGTNTWALGYALTLDNNDNIFITGGFGGPLSIDNYTITNDVNAGGHFLAKLDSDGNVIWGKNNYAGYGYALSVNNSGDVFLTGTYYTPTISIGSYTFTNYTPEGGFADSYLAKYSKDGEVLWATSIGGPGDDFGYSVTTDANSVYLVGAHPGTLSIGNFTLEGNATYDALHFARLDFDGNVNFATSLKSGGGNGNMQSWISVDNNGNAYIAGHFSCNPFYAGIYFTSLTGEKNVYLAKYHFTDVGIDEYKTEGSKFSIVPNPNDGAFTIRLRDPVVQKVEIAIFDITGKQVYSGKLSPQEENEVQLKTELQNGMYLVKVKLEDGTHDVHRLIISK